MRDTDERYRSESGTDWKFVAEFGLPSVAFSEALKSPGSSEGGLPGLFGASKKGSKRTHKKYVGGIFLDGTHIFYVGGSEMNSGCVSIPILGPSLAMLGPVVSCRVVSCGVG